MATMGRKEALILAAVAAGGLLLSPAIAATSSPKRPAPVSVSFDSIAAFTPANGDPKLAAALAGRGVSLSDFKFTPAPAKGRPSQLRVAIRARTTGPTVNAMLTDKTPAATPAMSALTPTTYNLGVAVGWRRFAISGDVAKSKDTDPAFGGRESAVLGVSYSLNQKITGRVAVGAERDDGKALPALRRSDNYAVDLGGSYSVSKRVALTGGLRYQIEKDRMSALHDERRDSQAVYVGTAVKF
ncbi:MAG TPA: porin [Sphingomicrobium sp.]|nr:porin [Sphingomicrobium sp.]